MHKVKLIKMALIENVNRKFIEKKNLIKTYINLKQQNLLNI